MLSNLYINHWISTNWHVEAFAIFNLVKRISSFIAFPLLVGAGIGIPRYISFLKEKKKAQNSYEYLLSGYLIFICTFILFTVLTMVFWAPFSNMFETSSIRGENVAGYVIFFIFSQGFYILLNAYYRGRLQFGLMSLLNIAIMSVLPVLSLFFSGDIFTYFNYYALATLAVVLSALFYLRLNIEISVVRIKLKASRLIRYGHTRIISDLGLFSLEFMPVFLVSVYIGLAESGYISMAFILFKLASASFEIAGTMTLPYFGNIYKRESPVIFVSKVNRLLIPGLICALVLSVTFYLLTPVAIKLYFPALRNAILPSQMLLLVFPLYTIYLLLRNILDIVVDKAHNSVNLGIVFVIQMLIMGIGLFYKVNIIYSILSIVVPYTVLGLLTYKVWRNVRGNILHAG